MDAVEVFLIWVNPDFGRGFLLRFLRWLRLRRSFGYHSMLCFNL